MNDFETPLNSNPITASSQELVPNSGLEGADMISGDSLSSSNSSMLPTLEEDILRYEAEDLTLTNYQIESNNASSSGKHISLVGSNGKTGTAEGVFNGEAGIYQVNVGFYDENDGVSSVDITVAGELESFLLDKDLPGNAAVAKTLTSRITHSEIELQPGDDFKIKSQQNVGEFARFDYVEFIPMDSPTDTDTDTGGDIDSPSDTDTDTGGEIDSPTDTDTDTGDEIDSPTDTDTDTGGEIDSPTDTDTDTGGEIDSPTDTDTDTGDEIDSPTDIDTDTGGDIDSPTDTDTDTGGEIDSPTDTDTDTGGKIDSPSDTDTYYVSPKGSNDNPGTKEKPWKTIDYAVGKDSAVKAGDTVLVQPGTYTELITLDKSGSKELGHINLKADGDVTLRDPDPIKGGFREGVIQSAGEGYWIIDGFRIENTSWAGISLRDANNMIVQNNHTFETGASGIIVLPETYYKGGDAEVTSKDIKVLDNKIERANWRWSGRGDTRGTQEALSIWGVDGFEVANNIVKEGNREGIDVKTGSRNGSVHNNTVTGVAQVSGTPGGYNGGPAIYVDGNRADTFNIDIYNNLVYGNVAEGITIADEIPQQGDVKDVRVYNNVVYGNGKLGTNGGAGIMVTSNVSGVEVINNTVAKNVQSIVIDGTDFTKGDKTSDVMVRNNIFADSMYRNGLIEDAENVVLDNNLFTNEFEELYEGGSGLKNFKETNNIEVKSVGFLDSKGNDYHLSSDSPAIDIGSDAIPNYASIDKDGVKRNKDDGDIGAYEYRASK